MSDHVAAVISAQPDTVSSETGVGTTHRAMLTSGGAVRCHSLSMQAPDLS